MKTKDITHRTVMHGEIMSEHSSAQLALMNAKKLAKENDARVYVEGWAIEKIVTHAGAVIEL